MSLAPGTRFGAYEIAALIGSGGMGEVYRARDATLGRDVAIKILPEAFLHDPERLARFKREAQVLASLNHPNIAAIYGFEPDAGDGRAALVLELVEGSTLADRIGQGPLPLPDAVSIARQLANALEAAHDRGVIHRDLKPANINLTPEGDVKVLDFGLAKPFHATGSGVQADPSVSPTMTSPAPTLSGVILGTASYMSPEQARGRPVDKRTDVWAFGCVLYEMLTGRRAFDGEDVTEVLSQILQREPDFTPLERHVPPAIARLLRRCLAKDRKKRLADIADARLELDEPVPPATPAPRHRVSVLVVSSLAAAVAIAAIGVTFMRPPGTPAATVRFPLNLPPGITRMGTVSVSPDGRYLAMNAAAGGPSSIWLRPLSTMTARELPGTEFALQPFWSPDNRYLGFFAAGSLKKIDIVNGAVSTIAPATTSFGFGTWGADGTIVFATGGVLYRVSANGGSPQELARPEGDANFDFPSFLPGTGDFLFADIRTIVPQRGAATIYLGSLGSNERKELLRADSRATYAGGHILFVRDRTLMAQAFDRDARTVTGEAFPIAEDIWVGAGGTPYFSVSDADVIVFPSRTGPAARLVWLDRTGQMVGEIGEPEDVSNPRLSADGTKLAVCIYNRPTRTRDIWIFDLARGARRRFTSDPADDMNPAWAPDASAIAFSSERKGQRDVYVKGVEGEDIDRQLLESPVPESVSDWSPDGRRILFNGPTRDGKGIGISAVDPVSGTSPETLVASSFGVANGQFSPDGRWIAFQSPESGRQEIYVAPESGSGKVILSTGGGIQPRWNRNGREVFYLNGARDTMMSAQLTLDGTRVVPGEVRALFKLDVADALGSLYDVAPDGQRFLVNVRVGDPIAPVSVILNWRSPSSR